MYPISIKKRRQNNQAIGPDKQEWKDELVH